eukprot:SAG31_NODE_3475_length_4230_cov_3.659162_2_plen_142_part_00
MDWDGLGQCRPALAVGTFVRSAGPEFRSWFVRGPRQARATNPFMPLFHIVGNFTDGDGTQPIAVNDISSVVQWKGAPPLCSSMLLNAPQCSAMLLNAPQCSYQVYCTSSTSLASAGGSIPHALPLFMAVGAGLPSTVMNHC